MSQPEDKDEAAKQLATIAQASKEVSVDENEEDRFKHDSIGSIKIQE